jgi:branched-chain amino acid transport system permease protein
MITASAINLNGFIVLPQQLVAFGASIALMLLIVAYFKFTRSGKWLQAIADNVKAATLVGIRVGALHRLAFALGAASAGAAAVLMAPLTLLYPDIGFNLFIKAFAAAVLGGLHSIAGAVIGGLIVGLVEALVAGYVGSKFQDVSAFVVIMLVLVFIPRGIMGGKAMRKV